MSIKPFTYPECKIQASILLKQLRSNSNIELIALFKQLPIFANLDNDDIRKKAQLKHALHLIANKHGFECWNNLKAYFEKTGQTMFNMHSGFLNQWFANYVEAKSYLGNHQTEFLLPYKKHFVVCNFDCIEYMGFDTQDNNWALIHHNWVEPEDYQAWEALNTQHSKIMKGQQNV